MAWCWAMADFNPRTPVGCDDNLHDSLATFEISIHAPQWGATIADPYPASRYGISIHAPQWGATVPVTVRDNLLKFQSTHPSGVRHRLHRSQHWPP